VYSDTGDYEKAKEYYLKALEIQKAAMGHPKDAIWAVT
jgi:tetratricopeptide (TPR) repeat protein